MEKKNEPKYLDLSAECEINVAELIQRILKPPAQTDPEKEDKHEHHD